MQFCHSQCYAQMIKNCALNDRSSWFLLHFASILFLNGCKIFQVQLYDTKASGNEKLFFIAPNISKKSAINFTKFSILLWM